MEKKTNSSDRAERTDWPKLRDEIAMVAMGTLIRLQGEGPKLHIATQAYEFADAMLAQRAKK